MEAPSYVTKHRGSGYSLFKERKPLLSHLDIELTERCNNACLHCYINRSVDDPKVIRRELSTDQWKDILRQAADLGALSVRFTGGEPLLRSDFGDIYLFARQLGMKVMLFTNACLITPDLVELFARVPPLKKIEVSVYGMRSESYDAVTCSPDAFRQFRQGLDLLMARNIPFFVKSVLLPPNRDEMDEFEAWAGMLPWMDRQPPYAMFLDHRTRRDSPARNRLIDQLRLSPEDGLKILIRDEDSYRKNMVKFCASYIGPPGDRLFDCEAGESGCVDAYGYFQMCMHLRDPDLVCDLKASTLHHALTEIFPRWREIRATNPLYLSRCAGCFLKGLCEQCPGKSWSEHGTLDTPVEYHCELAHVQARYLGLLTEHENGWEVRDWRERIAKLVHEYAPNPASNEESDRQHQTGCVR